MYTTRLLVLFGCFASLMLSCTTEDPPESCRKAYVYIPKGDFELRIYERYFPRQQEYGYYRSEYRVPQDSVTHVYQIEKNIYLKRNELYKERKRVVTHDVYIDYCGDRRTELDTVFILVNTGDGIYTEYRVYDQYDLVENDTRLTRREVDGTRHVLTDFNAPEGTEAMYGEAIIAVGKKSSFYCKDLMESIRTISGDTLSETYIKDVGMSFRDDGEVQQRLRLIDGQEVIAHVSQLCNK